MQPTGVHIRDAHAKDWLAVATLLAELGRPDVRGTQSETEGRRSYEQYLKRPDAVTLVAEAGGRVVGFVDIEFRNWLNFTTPQAWTPDLVVAETARGRGIGGALLDRAEEIAIARKSWSMALESASWRKRAHAFYLSHGWTETGKAFTKLLTDLQWPPPPTAQGLNPRDRRSDFGAR